MTSYRIIQDGQPVAWVDNLRDAMHYAMVYAEDGPVILQHKTASGRWVKVKEPSQ